jgi:hypothetical protein
VEDVGNAELGVKIGGGHGQDECTPEADFDGVTSLGAECYRLGMFMTLESAI